jgi:hypothetical protein
MKTFINSPFNLDDGSRIHIQVNALMEQGWGSFQTVSQQQQATVQTPPSGIDNLSAGASGNSDMQLTWNMAGKQGEKYWILMSKGQSEAYSRVGVSKTMSFVVKNMELYANYLFKVRAYNLCGYVESNPLQYTRGGLTPPVRPTLPVVGSSSITTNGCNANIAWPFSTQGHTSDVQVMGSDKRYHKVNVCGQRGVSSCTFHMSFLAYPPFNLAINSAIQGRIRSCIFGRCSEYSTLRSTAVVITAPPSAIPDTQFEQLMWDNEGNT